MIPVYIRNIEKVFQMGAKQMKAGKKIQNKKRRAGFIDLSRPSQELKSKELNRVAGGTQITITGTSFGVRKSGDYMN